MSSKTCFTILGAAAALASILLGGSPLQAQATTPATSACLTESSFEFPLWNDGIGWKQFNEYSSIQLADIDGDGQAELIGKGPKGVEIWHWEPHGQAWIQMNVGAPILASTDTLMTADVDGDGQSEIIQLTPNLGSSPVVNVWHYDGSVNPQSPAGPGVWRLQPQLRLTLTPSVGSNATPLAPIIKFATLSNPSGKQQQLVSMSIRVTPGLVYYTPFVYQVNASQTGWVAVAQGPTTNGGGTFTNSSPGSMQIGDVNGDGKPDIVVLEGAEYFLIFTQQSASSGQVTFGSGTQVHVPLAVNVYSFTLADTLAAGYDQIYVADFFSNAENSYRPGNYWLEGYQFTAQGLQEVTARPAVSTTAAAANYAAVSGTLQTAQTGLNPSNPTGQSILMLDGNGLEEFRGQRLGGLLNTSNSPFVSFARFGDDPSHYLTIQTGTVFAYNNSSTPYSETLVVARDANGIHTLVPTRAGSICGSTLAGFDLPQKNMSGNYFYFPTFVSSCTAQESSPATSQAYAYFNSLAGVNDLRTEYSNINVEPSSYQSTISAAPYPTNYPGPGPTAFSKCDFLTVQSQLGQEITDVINVRGYFGTTAGSGVVSSNLQYVNTGESSALNTAIGDLSLSAEQEPSNSAFAVNVATQVISSIFDFIGNLGFPVASQVSEVFSVVGDVISDVQGAESATGSSLEQQGLTLQTQLAATYADQQQANANSLSKVLQNWDLLSQLEPQLVSSVVTPTDNNDVNNRAVNAYAISTWQQLMPSAWSIIAVGCSTGEDFLPAGYQPYFVDAPDYSPADASDCYSFPTYVVYAKLQSTSDGGLSSIFSTFNVGPAPVAVQALQDLLALGVNWYDVLGRRNGWQQVPLDLTDLVLSVTPTVPANNPYFNPPAPLVPPAAGAPFKLTLSNGEPTGNSQQQCGSNSTEPDIYQQSTPVNSVFPLPISISVVDAANLGVPNATIQIHGVGLSPNTSTIVTDSSGSATAYLLANNIVQAQYTTTFSVNSPGSSCNLTQQYKLQNTPAVQNLSPANPDVQAVVSVTSKGAVFTTDRLWNLSIIDPTQIATGGTVTAQLTRTRGSASCQPVPVLADNLHPTGTPGKFTSKTGWDFSSCTGLNLFTLTVSGSFIIPLDDGTSYSATYSASTNNQTP